MKATNENLERHRATRPDAAQALGELTAFARREGAELTAAMGAAFAAIRDRREEKCTYRPALLGWAMLGMFLFRRGSVNALDAQHPVGSAHPSWLREVSGLSPVAATGRLVARAAHLRPGKGEIAACRGGEPPRQAAGLESVVTTFRT